MINIGGLWRPMANLSIGGNGNKRKFGNGSESDNGSRGKRPRLFNPMMSGAVPVPAAA